MYMRKIMTRFFLVGQTSLLTWLGSSFSPTLLPSSVHSLSSLRFRALADMLPHKYPTQHTNALLLALLFSRLLATLQRTCTREQTKRHSEKKKKVLKPSRARTHTEPHLRFSVLIPLVIPLLRRDDRQLPAAHIDEAAVPPRHVVRPGLGPDLHLDVQHRQRLHGLHGRQLVAQLRGEWGRRPGGRAGGMHAFFSRVVGALGTYAHL